MIFRQIFDRESCTYTYLIAAQEGGVAAIVDPCKSLSTQYLTLIDELNLKLTSILETHIHADHITAASTLKKATGATIYVPQNSHVTCDAIELGDQQTLEVDGITIKALSTPGHTDSHNAYLINYDRVLTGDVLFIRGCGRTDFQNGDAHTLYKSVTQKLFCLPDDTLVFPGHDYKGQTCSTIGEEKRFNPRLNKDEHSFIEIMDNLNLPMPNKIKEAVPANLKCGDE